jgi:hypothetical protein
MGLIWQTQDPGTGPQWQDIPRELGWLPTQGTPGRGPGTAGGEGRKRQQGGDLGQLGPEGREQVSTIMETMTKAVGQGNWAPTET